VKLIATTTVTGSNAANISFTSIPDTYTDLVLLCSLRNTPSDSNDTMLRFNGVTTSYSQRTLLGSGSAVSTNTGTSATYLRLYAGANPPSYTSNTFSNLAIYIPNYTASVNKSVSVDTVTENNATAAFQGMIAGLWSNTAAITSIELDFYDSVSEYLVGSSASLYGITKGSDGIVTVS
jgi:hypothetical protein